MNDVTKREMPKYRSHKEVWALKIEKIDAIKVEDFIDGPQDDEAMLYFEDEGFGPKMVSSDYVKKHQPKAGGYYVVYKDGYESWSPESAFEEGYTRI